MTPEFSMDEGLSLSLSYMEDPSNVACPKCGPHKIEVLAFLDPLKLEKKELVLVSPDYRYTVIMYCHGCKRAVALDFSSLMGAR